MVKHEPELHKRRVKFCETLADPASLWKSPADPSNVALTRADGVRREGIEPPTR